MSYNLLTFGMKTMKVLLISKDPHSHGSANTSTSCMWFTNTNQIKNQIIYFALYTLSSHVLR